MEDYQKTMVRSLVAIAWADGRIESGEGEVIDAFLSAFEATPAECAELRDYAKSKRSLEDLSLDQLTPSDRDALLQHAVLLTHIDGTQTESEHALVVDLAKRLGFEDERRDALIAQATTRAKRLLS